MIKKGRLFLLLAAVSLPIWGRPQIYIGLQGEIKNAKHVLTLGNQGWNDLLLEAYQKNLEALTSTWLSRVKDNSSNTTSNNPTYDVLPYWLTNGPPKNLFQDLLDDNSPEVDRKHVMAFDIRALAGAYLFRHEKMLIAAEFFIRGSSFSRQVSTQQNLLDSDVPELLLTAYRNGSFSTQTASGANIYNTQESSLNPMANSLLPYIYVHPGHDIQAKNDVKVSSHFSFGGDIRLGTIFRDRAFLYAILGGQGGFFSVDGTLTLASGLPSLLVFYYASTGPSAYDTNVPYGVDTLRPSGSVNTSPRKFTKSKLKWGILGGAGIEFYLNHKLAIRTDVTMTYYTDLSIKAQDSINLIKLTHKPWHISFGVVYRFSSGASGTSKSS